MGMSIYDLVKKYGKGKSEAVMWESTKLLSDALKPMKDSHPDEYWKLVKELYALMCGPHYDDEFGEWQIDQMYYTDKLGKKHCAPYWTEDQIKSVYEANKSKIKSSAYTLWDFAVVMNMIKSDNWCLFKSWWPEATESELDTKVIEASINYLNDEDAPHKDEKVWAYFNK